MSSEDRVKPPIEAYDDGYFPPAFKGGRGDTLIVGVEVSPELHVERVALSRVRVDMNTSMRAIISISRLFEGEVVLLDGVTYSGFDIVDPDEVSMETGKSVIVVFTHPLNLKRIEDALSKHFEDWRDRYAVIERVYKSTVHFYTPWRYIRLYIRGLDLSTVRLIFKNTCLYSPVPEPLRLADKLASSLSNVYFPL